MRKIILIILGFVSLFLGILGIFLPLLPTTPFLLISAACFVRSSEKLYNWLIRHKLFGSQIESYRKHKAISKNSKITALIILWATMCVSIILFSSNVWLCVILVSIALGVTIHIALIRILTNEMVDDQHVPNQK
jgi:hypothetical protein